MEREASNNFLKEKSIDDLSVESVSKGYRLKPETHALVDALSIKINGTKDQVISRACKMLENAVNCSAKKNENKSGNKKYNKYKTN
ncbi:MAG: hypothetical protein IT280_09625 [Ignavibacteria bacterium]|nr:hypothetical protein [Ignavibacteria bacterium]